MTIIVVRRHQLSCAEVKCTWLVLIVEVFGGNPDTRIYRSEYIRFEAQEF